MAAAAGIATGDDWFRHNPVDGGGFAALVGRREVYVFDAGGPTGAISLALAKAATDKCWMFPREDFIFLLRGEGWREMLLEVCAHEFEQNSPGDFVMTTMAGVGCWLALPMSVDAPVILGCDPSYGHYLQQTIENVLNEGQFPAAPPETESDTGKGENA